MKKHGWVLEMPFFPGPLLLPFRAKQQHIPSPVRLPATVKTAWLRLRMTWARSYQQWMLGAVWDGFGGKGRGNVDHLLVSDPQV